MPTRLDSADFRRILTECMPDECEMAGRRFVAAVSDAAVSGQDAKQHLGRPDEAAHVNPEAVLIALAASANFVKACVEIYLALEKRNGSKPSTKQYNTEVAKTGAGLVESGAKLAASVFKAMGSS